MPHAMQKEQNIALTVDDVLPLNQQQSDPFLSLASRWTAGHRWPFGFVGSPLLSARALNLQDLVLFSLA